MRRAITSATRGFGDRFVHRTGHSIGDEVHGTGANMDNLETHDERRILPGALFSIEPGIYLEDFGVRSEVDVFVTANSPRRRALFSGNWSGSDNFAAPNENSVEHLPASVSRSKCSAGSDGMSTAAPDESRKAHHGRTGNRQPVIAPRPFKTDR